MIIEEQLRSLNRQMSGLVWRHRRLLNRMGAAERRQGQLEQAILEMSSALRRSGITAGELALPSPSETSVPDRQSADREPTIPA